VIRSLHAYSTKYLAATKISTWPSAGGHLDRANTSKGSAIAGTRSRRRGASGPALPGARARPGLRSAQSEHLKGQSRNGRMLLSRLPSLSSRTSAHRLHENTRRAIVVPFQLNREGLGWQRY
jgi:hypothetical protein